MRLAPWSTEFLISFYVTLRIVDFLRASELRFTELQRSIGDVNSVTLSNRLKRLEAAGMIGNVSLGRTADVPSTAAADRKDAGARRRGP
jgi:hypothetical protein